MEHLYCRLWLDWLLPLLRSHSLDLRVGVATLDVFDFFSFSSRLPSSLNALLPLLLSFDCVLGIGFKRAVVKIFTIFLLFLLRISLLLFLLPKLVSLIDAHLVPVLILGSDERGFVEDSFLTLSSGRSWCLSMWYFFNMNFRSDFNVHILVSGGWDELGWSFVSWSFFWDS